MVDIIFEIHPDWSVRKTLSQIASDLGDLKGFSVRQLYRFLDHVFDLERLKKVSSSQLNRANQRIVVNEKGEEGEGGEGIREARFEDSSLFYNNTKNQVPTVEPSRKTKRIPLKSKQSIILKLFSF